jgi:hypothetical protein
MTDINALLADIERSNTEALERRRMAVEQRTTYAGQRDNPPLPPERPADMPRDPTPYVSSAEEFAALEPGAIFIDGSGRRRRKKVPAPVPTTPEDPQPMDQRTAPREPNMLERLLRAPQTAADMGRTITEADPARQQPSAPLAPPPFMPPATGDTPLEIGAPTDARGPGYTGTPPAGTLRGIETWGAPLQRPDLSNVNTPPPRPIMSATRGVTQGDDPAKGVFGNWGALNPQERIEGQQQRIDAAQEQVRQAQAVPDRNVARLEAMRANPPGPGASRAEQESYRRNLADMEEAVGAAVRAQPDRVAAANRAVGDARVGTAPVTTTGRAAADALPRGAADVLTSGPAIQSRIYRDILRANPQMRDTFVGRYLDGVAKANERIERAPQQAFPGDPSRGDEMPVALSQGAGSMVAFLAAARINPTLAAGAGATSMGKEQYDDAVRHGADMVTRYGAMLAGMGLGATEALPIMNFLDRLNEASGGRAGSFVAAKLQAIGRGAALGGAEEFLQELTQAVGSDVVARVLYDQNREIGKDALQQAQVGGILGAALGAFGGAARRRGVAEERRPGDAPAAADAPLPADDIRPLTPEDVPGGRVEPRLPELPAPSEGATSPSEAAPAPSDAPDVAPAPTVSSEPSTEISPAPDADLEPVSPAEASAPTLADVVRTTDDAAVVDVLRQAGREDSEILAELSSPRRRARALAGALDADGNRIEPRPEGVQQVIDEVRTLRARQQETAAAGDARSAPADRISAVESTPPVSAPAAAQILGIRNEDGVVQPGTSPVVPPIDRGEPLRQETGEGVDPRTIAIVQQAKQVGATVDPVRAAELIDRREALSPDMPPARIERLALIDAVREVRANNGQSVPASPDYVPREAPAPTPAASPGTAPILPRPLPSQQPATDGGAAPPSAAIGDRAQTPVAPNPVAAPLPPGATSRPRAPRRTDRPESLIAFLRGAGGLRMSPELAAIGITQRRFPGLMRANGMDIDTARRAAAQFGFFPQYGTNDDATSNSYPSDLLDLLDREARGERVYNAEDQQRVQAPQRLTSEDVDAPRNDPNVGRSDEARAAIADFIYENGYQGIFDQDIQDRAALLMMDGETDVSVAIEAATLEMNPVLNAREKWYEPNIGWVDPTFYGAGTDANETQRGDLPADRAGDPDGSRPVDERGGTVPSPEKPQPSDGVSADGQQATETDRESATGRDERAEAAPDAQPEEAAEVAPQPALVTAETGADGKPQLVMAGGEQSADAAKAAAAARAKAEMEARQKQSKLRRGGQKPIDEQDGGLFADKPKDLFSADPPSSQQPLTDQTLSPQYTSNNPPPFVVPAVVGLGDAAKDYVVEIGKLTGVEHMVMLDGNALLALVRGKNNGVTIPPDANALLLDPTKSIVVHHNHPQSTGFSVQDLAMLSSEGMAVLYAHGHDGRTVRAQLTPVGRAVAARDLKQYGDNGRFSRWRGVIDLVRRRLEEKMIPEVKSGELTPDHAGELHHLLISETLVRVGLITFEDTKAPQIQVRDKDNARIEALANEIRSYLIGTVTDGVDRPAERVRLPGELGEAPRGSVDASAERDGAQAGNSDRQANDQAEKTGRSSLTLSAPSNVRLATKGQIEAIARRFGNVITSEFGIDPGTLTADDARSILAIRKDVDGGRAGLAAAMGDQRSRLLAKGVAPKDLSVGQETRREGLTVRSSLDQRPFSDRGLPEVNEAPSSSGRQPDDDQFSRAPRRREVARSLSASLTSTQIIAPAWVNERLGLGPDARFHANYQRLASKHPEAFATVEDAKRHVESVLSDPHLAVQTADKSNMQLIRRDATDQLIVYRLQRRGGVYDIRSAYVLEPGNVEAKLSAAGRAGSLVIRLQQEADPGATSSRDEEYKAARGVDQVAPASMPPAVQEQVAEIVRRVAGVDVTLVDTIDVAPGAAGRAEWGMASSEPLKAQGSYSAMNDIVKVALDLGSPGVAYHEAFHRVQAKLATPQEIALLDREDARLRELVRLDRGEQARDMSSREVQAEAFRLYATARDAGRHLPGIHAIIRRLWQRLHETFRRVRNALSGMGYQTSEDVFARAFSGEMAGGAARPGATFPALNDRRHLSEGGQRGENASTDGQDQYSSPAADIIGYGPFGPILRGYEGRWIEAALRLDQLKSGEAIDALSHPEVGPITLMWGQEGTGASTGYGLSKIVAWHPEVVPNLQERISRMTATQLSPNRIHLRSATDRGAIRLDWDGQKGKWLLSAYEEGVRRSQKSTWSLRELWARSSQTPPDTQDRIAKFDERQSGEQYSLPPPRPATWTAPSDPQLRELGGIVSATFSRAKLPELGNLVRYNFQDAFVDQARAQRAVIDAGGVITQDQDFYAYQSLMANAAGEKLKTAAEGLIRPLLVDMTRKGVDVQELGLLLVAQHAAERKAVVAQRLAKTAAHHRTMGKADLAADFDRRAKRAADPGDAFGAGMSVTEAEAIVAKHKADGTFDKYDGYAERWRELSNRTLRIQRDAGLISAETYNRLQSTYEFYAPLKMWEDMEPGDDRAVSGMGRGLDIRGKEFQGAAGRESRAENPIVHIIEAHYRAIWRAEKNKALKSFLAFVRGHPNAEFARILDELPTTTSVDENGIVRERGDTSLLQRNDVVGVKENGNVVYIQVNHQRLANALHTMGPEQLGSVLRSVANVTRAMSAMNTARNPEWFIANVMRDVQEALLNADAVAEKDLPELRAKFLGNLSVAYKTALIGLLNPESRANPTTVRMVRGSTGAAVGGIVGGGTSGAYGALAGVAGGVVHGFMSDGTISPELAEDLREFDRMRRDGGMTGFARLMDLDGIRDELKHIVEETSNPLNPVNAARTTARNGVQAIEYFGSVFEAMTRFAFYKAVYETAKAHQLEKGATEAEAEKAARFQAARGSSEVTINFSRKGRLGPSINALYMFMNASIQGVTRSVTSLATSKKARLIAGGAGLAGAVLAMAPYLLGDEEDRKDWERIEEFQKGRNFIIYIPRALRPMLQQMGLDPGAAPYFKIPVSHSLRIFKVAGESIVEMMLGNRKPSDAAVNIVSAGLEGYNPAFGDSPTKVGPLALIPSIGRPLVDVWANVNFTGRPIQYQDRFNPSRPLADQSGPQTSYIANQAAWALNWLGGGTQFQKPAKGFDWSGTQLEHIFFGYTGGLGRFIANTVDFAKRKATGETVEPERTPFVRQFYGNANSPATVAREFQEINQRAREAHDSMRAALRAGAREEVQQIRRDRAHDLRMFNYINAGQDDRLRTLRQQADRVRRDQNLSAADRSTRLREIERQRADVHRRVIERHLATRDQQAGR